MKIRTVNFLNFFKKAKRYGFFIPFSNFLLVHLCRVLPAKLLDKIAEQRNRMIEDKVVRIVGDVVVEDSELTETENPKIWMVWFSGEENLPPLQKMCVDSVRRNANGHEVVMLSLQNYKKYIDIPEKILELYHKGILNPANLCDVIRMRVLSKYGGFWIDSTVYVTDPITDQFFKTKLYSMKKQKEWYYVSKCRWSSFCFYMNKSSLLPHVVDKMLMKYWESETWIIDYFLIDYLIDIATKKYQSIRDEINEVPFNNPNLYELNSRLCDKFSADDFAKLKSNTSFFKLSWKVFSYDQLTANQDNYYNYLMRNEKF